MVVPRALLFALLCSPAASRSAPRSTPRKQEAEDYCMSVIATTDTTHLLKEGWTSILDAYDADRFGRPTIECVEILLRNLEQWDKADYYLHSIMKHCEECSAGPCQSSDVGIDGTAECKGAALNYWGYLHIRKEHPDLALAEKYYREALDVDAENCPAAISMREVFDRTGRLPEDDDQWYVNTLWYCERVQTGRHRIRLAKKRVLATDGYFGKPSKWGKKVI